MRFTFWTKEDGDKIDYKEHKLEIFDSFSDKENTMIAFAFISKLNFRNQGIPCIEMNEEEISYEYLCRQIKDGRIVVSKEIELAFFSDNTDLEVVSFSLEV